MECSYFVQNKSNGESRNLKAICWGAICVLGNFKTKLDAWLRTFYLGNRLQIIHQASVSDFFIIQILKWAETPYFNNFVPQLPICSSSISLIPLKGELTIILDLSCWHFNLLKLEEAKRGSDILN